MGYRILIVEDDEDTLSNLKDILELDGCITTGVRTVREALQHRPWSDYPLILLDRTLLDGTADELLPLIQQSAPRTACIVMTGHADWDGVLAALRCGAADYLLKPINGEMLRMVIARVKKLQELEEAMTRGERLAAIGQMATGIAHESRNALQRIGASAEMLEMEVAGNETARRYVSTILKSQAELRTLLDEVRNYASSIVLDRCRCRVSDVWREAWELLAPARSGREAALHECGDARDAQIDIDRYRLIQVFRNLFENSLAATEGPLHLEIACNQTISNNAFALRIDVRDNGPGLNPEQRLRVFEPFFTTKQKGTGLGMAIAHRIMEAHGGRIEAVGRDSPGAEFNLYLPYYGQS